MVCLCFTCCQKHFSVVTDVMSLNAFPLSFFRMITFWIKTRSRIVAAVSLTKSPQWVMHTGISTKGINCSCDLRQHNHLNIPPLVISDGAFFYSRHQLFTSHHLELSHCRETNYVLLVVFDTLSVSVWFDFFLQRGGWDLLVSPHQLQTHGTKWRCLSIWRVGSGY